MRNIAKALACGLFVTALSGAYAAPTGTEPPTLTLSADAFETVAEDKMVVTVGVERSGPNVAPLNAEVLRELAWAVGEAKKLEGVESSTGNLSTQQTWVKGKPADWRVSGSLVLKSTRTKELGELAGRLSERLQLNGLNFELSKEARAAAESRLIAQASHAFTAKAETTSKALGFAGYAVQSVQLTNEAGVVPRLQMMAAAPGVPAPMALHRQLGRVAGSDTAEPPAVLLGVPGTVDVRMQVSGSVVLKN